MSEINMDDVENPTTTNSSSIWSYAQTLLKGIGILAVGGVAYTFLRSLTTRSSSLSNNENSLSVVNEKVLSENLENSYHYKRDIVPVTNEFLVNTYTTDEQIHPAIANLAQGGFVITWQSFNQVSSTSTYDIYAQRYADNGATLGSEFLVNTYITSAQSLPAVAGLVDGDFVIAWTSFNQVSSTSSSDIYAQRYASNGAALDGEFLVNTYTLGNQQSPAIIGLADGGFVITWTSGNQVSGTSQEDIYAQRYAGNGAALGSEFLVNTYTINSQTDPVIASLTDGGFVITWVSSSQASSTSAYDVYAQRYAGNGAALGSEFLVNTYTVNAQWSPAIAGLADGSFVITWWYSAYLEGGNQNSGIYGQRYANDGTASGSEFLVKTAGVNPTVTSLANGQFVVACRQPNNQNGYDIYAQRYASNGIALEAPFKIISFISASVSSLNTLGVVALADSQFVVAWDKYDSSSDFNVYAKILTTNYELPLLLQNNLTIKQGETLSLSTTNLLANSGGGTAFNDLLFLVSDLQNGYFTRLNQTTQAIFNFTQAEIKTKQIQFSQNDSNLSPSYQIAVYDGFNATDPQATTVDFYSKPQFIHNQFSITNNKATQLSVDMLLAMTGRSDLEIFFDVRNVSQGVFSLNAVANSLANAITSFNQSQINSGQIWFVHDGSNKAPSYAIRATCAGVESNYQLSQITFTPTVIPKTTSATRNKSTIIGAAVGATGGVLLLVGLGIFGGYRHKKAKDYAAERAQYPLANALYKVLPVDGVADFKSVNGVAFINAVNAIENYLTLDMRQMIEEEFTELANKLARAIKAQVNYKEGLFGGITLNLANVEYHAETIAKIAQTLDEEIMVTGSNANTEEMRVMHR